MAGEVLEVLRIKAEPQENVPLRLSITHVRTSNAVGAVAFLPSWDRKSEKPHLSRMWFLEVEWPSSRK